MPRFLPLILFLATSLGMPLAADEQLEDQVRRHQSQGDHAAALKTLHQILEGTPATTRVHWRRTTDEWKQGPTLGGDGPRAQRLAQLFAGSGETGQAAALLRVAGYVGEESWRELEWGQPYVDQIAGPLRSLMADRWYLPPAEATLQVLGQEQPLLLSDLRGNIVVLDFWATWCPPCVEGLPKLDAIRQQYLDRNVRVYAVNSGEAPHVAVAFIEDQGLSLPVVTYEETLAAAFDVGSLPTLIILDSEGRIRRRWDSYLEGSQALLPKIIEKLLGPDKPVEIGQVLQETGGVSVQWMRGLPARVSAITAVQRHGERFWLASVGSRLVLFSPSGKIMEQWNGKPSFRRLLAMETKNDGSTRVLGYRPGSSKLTVIDIAGPHITEGILESPLFDAAMGADGRLWLATQQGVLQQAISPEGRLLNAAPVGPAGLATAIDARAGGGLLALVRTADGSKVLTIDPEDEVTDDLATPDASAWAVEKVGETVALLPQDVTDRTTARLGPEGQEKLVMILNSDQLLVLDPTTGAVDLRMRIDDLRALAVADMDGDGRDEIAVSADRRLFLLSISP